MTTPFAPPRGSYPLSARPTGGLRFRICATILCISSAILAALVLPRFLTSQPGILLQHWVFGFTPVCLLFAVGVTSVFAEFFGSKRAKKFLPIVLLLLVPVIGIIMYSSCMGAIRTFNGQFDVRDFAREVPLLIYALFLSYYFGAVFVRSRLLKSNQELGRTIS